MRHRIAAEMLMANQQADSAVSEFQQALALDPNMADASYELGELYQQLNRSPEAAATFQHLCTINPSRDNYYCLGNAHFSLHDYQQAKKDYSQAISLDPGYAEAHFNLAVTCMQLKEFTLAKAELLQVLALQPDYPNAQKYLHLCGR